MRRVRRALMNMSIPGTCMITKSNKGNFKIIVCADDPVSAMTVARLDKLLNKGDYLSVRCYFAGRDSSVVCSWSNTGYSSKGEIEHFHFGS